VRVVHHRLDAIRKDSDGPAGLPLAGPFHQVHQGSPLACGHVQGGNADPLATSLRRDETKRNGNWTAP
jgi:hypothetical protein